MSFVSFLTVTKRMPMPMSSSASSSLRVAITNTSPAATMTMTTRMTAMAKTIRNASTSSRHVAPYTYSVASSLGIVGGGGGGGVIGTRISNVNESSNGSITASIIRSSSSSSSSSNRKLSASSFFPSSKTSYGSQSQLHSPSQSRFFSSTSTITDEEQPTPPTTHYVSRSKRMTPTNGIETDIYDRAKRKNRSAPTRDLNYTPDMWKKHKSPWRHLNSTMIWYDSAFQRLLFPDLAIVATLAIGLSTITLQSDFFVSLIPLSGSEFINNLESLEKAVGGITATTGTLVALLLGYRVNTTYDRYCDARTMYGELTNASRDLARNVCMYIPTATTTTTTPTPIGAATNMNSNESVDDTTPQAIIINSTNKALLMKNKNRLLNLTRMYPIALHFFLTTKGSHHKLKRKHPDFPKHILAEFKAECIDMWKIYDDDDVGDANEILTRMFDAFKDGKHVPLLVLNMMGKCLTDLSSLKSTSSSASLNIDNNDHINQVIINNINIINPIYIREIDNQIQRISSGPFERILRTPMPTAFTRYASRVTTIWAYTVPFGLITDLGPYFNPIGSVFVVYCVMAIDDIGIQLEEPFNILPQRQYSDGIVDAVNLIDTTFDVEDKKK
jgi:hypothetical protein